MREEELKQKMLNKLNSVLANLQYVQDHYTDNGCPLNFLHRIPWNSFTKCATSELQLWLNYVSMIVAFFSQTNQKCCMTEKPKTTD